MPQLLSYVAFVANDTAASGALPIESRVYLLDQVGDRVNILTNSRTRGAGLSKRALSQPRDRFSPKLLLASATDYTQPVGPCVDLPLPVRLLSEPAVEPGCAADHYAGGPPQQPELAVLRTLRWIPGYQ